MLGDWLERVVASVWVLANNEEESRPDPCGSSAACSLPRDGFGDGALEGVADDVFFSCLVNLDVEVSTSIVELSASGSIVVRALSGSSEDV